MRPSLVPQDRLLVLLYHNVGSSPGGRGLPAHWTEPAALRAQIHWLRAAGHTFVDVEGVRDWVAQGGEPHPLPPPLAGEGVKSLTPLPPSPCGRGGESLTPLPPSPCGRGGGARGVASWRGVEREISVTRPTLLTFDDGQVNLYTHAWPVLEQAGVPALVFMVAGHVGGLTTWEDHPGWRSHPLLTWEQMREMQERGVTFGSHTLTHRRLSRLPEEEWRWELAESKRLLEEGLERPVEALAYPYGDFSPEIGRAALEAGYRLCFSTRPGLNGPDPEATALRRMNVRRHGGLWQFRRKVGRMARL